MGAEKGRGPVTAYDGAPECRSADGAIGNLVASNTTPAQAETTVDCEQCGVLFRPVRFEQRFCSAGCRRAFHNAHRPASQEASQEASQASQASQEASQASQEASQASQETRLNDNETPADAGSHFSEFDWHRDPDVVVPDQSAVAVYENTSGAIVIRQQGHYPDDDQWVIIQRENLAPLIAALQRLAQEE
jgi:hypothetical protein